MTCIFCFRFFNNVSIASKKLFETYIIKNIQETNYKSISKEITKAIKRSSIYGPRVQLDLQFSEEFDNNKKEKKMLTLYRDHIVSLANIKYLRTLLGLELTNITRLDIDFYNEYNHYVCEAILDRYGDKLEHLGVKNLDNSVFGNRTLKVYPLYKLKSLTLGSFNSNIIQSFMDAVNKEIITHLSLDFNGKEIGFEIYILEYNFGEIALTKLTHLAVSNTLSGYLNSPFHNIDMSDLIIPNLYSLQIESLSDKEVRSLIKCIKISKMEIQHLELCNIDGGAAFSLLECSRNSITTLILRNLTWFSDKFNSNFRMENLKFLQLVDIGHKVFQCLAEINNLERVSLSISNLRRKRVDGIWKRRLET